ncbi:MAG: CPBP family intramembrane glutamic endopeptidase, partial [Gemmatimonadales bacterium]
SHDAISGVRNGADVLLKSVFLMVGGRTGLIVFGLLLVGTGALFVIRDWKRAGPPRGQLFLRMAAESVGYALVFGLVAGMLTVLLLRGPGAFTSFVLSIQQEGGGVTMTQLPVPTQLMISLGAGLYEELLFRVLMVGSLAWLGRYWGWSPLMAGVFATIVGALIFSAFHYIGPYGDVLQLSSFTFRAIAGVLFSALYLLRGFGITAWTHALYDVFLTVGF